MLLTRVHMLYYHGSFIHNFILFVIYGHNIVMHRKERYLNLLFIRAAVSDVCKIYCDGFKFWPENEWLQYISNGRVHVHVCVCVCWTVCMGEARPNEYYAHQKLFSTSYITIHHALCVRICIRNINRMGYNMEKLSDILLQ